MRHEQGEEEHDCEIDDQRSGDPYHGDDLMHNAVALGCEEDEDREEEADQGPRTQILQKGTIIPLRPSDFPNRQPRNDSRAERNAQKHRHARGNRPIRHPAHPLIAAPPSNHLDEENRQRRVKHHLQNRIHRHEDGAILAVPAGEPHPHQHHGNAPRQPDQHQADPQALPVRQERPREREHEQGRHDPVERDGKRNLDPHRPGAQDAVEGFEADFAEDGVHHGEEAEGDGEGDAEEFALLEGGGGGGDEVAEEDADGHGEEDPEGEEAVEEAEGVEGGEFGGGGLGGLFGVVGGEDGEGGGGVGVVLHCDGVGLRCCV